MLSAPSLRCGLDWESLLRAQARRQGEFLFCEIILEIGAGGGDGTLIAKRTSEFANFLSVLFEKKIGAELGAEIFGKCGAQGFLGETVAGVPFGGGPGGIAAKEAKCGVNGVGRNGGDRNGFGEEENFFGGGVADGRKLFQGFLSLGQRALEDGAHVAGKFVEDARRDFFQAKRGEFRFHDAGAHDFAELGVGGVENFLRGEADFFFQRAKAFVAAFVGLRIAAVAVQEHFVRVGGMRRFRLTVEFFEAIENRGERSGLRGAFGHDEMWPQRSTNFHHLNPVRFSCLP